MTAEEAKKLAQENVQTRIINDLNRVNEWIIFNIRRACLDGKKVVHLPIYDMVKYEENINVIKKQLERNGYRV